MSGCIKLTQDVFIGQPKRVKIAVVDWKGTLRFGKRAWEWDPTASMRENERWYNCVGVEADTNYEPITSIVREKLRRWRR